MITNPLIYLLNVFRPDAVEWLVGRQGQSYNKNPVDASPQLCARPPSLATFITCSAGTDGRAARDARGIFPFPPDRGEGVRI